MKYLVPLLLFILCFNSFIAASLPFASQDKNSIVYKFHQETSHGLKNTKQTQLELPSEFSPSLLTIFFKDKYLAGKVLRIFCHLKSAPTESKNNSFPFLPHSQAPPLLA